LIKLKHVGSARRAALDAPGNRRAVDPAQNTVAASREIVWIYNRWVVRPLLSGVLLGMPMSVRLRRSFERIGLPPD